MTHKKLSALQKRILVSLCRGAREVGELRQLFPEISAPSLSRAISRLQDRGIIERLAAKRQGVGAIVRRNVNLIGKDHKEKDWWVERVWEWDGNNFVDITRHPTKRFSLSSPATE